MNKSTNIRSMTIFSLFLAIECVLLMTPLGFLRIGPLSATLLHIPVILAAILLGTKYGVLMGLFFGLASVWNATVAPGPISFVFSPFITIGGMSGGWQSLIVAIVPRVALGWIAGVLFSCLKKTRSRACSAGIAAGIATLVHTIFVLGLIVIFYGTMYASALGIAQNALMGVLVYTVATNGMLELVLAVAVSVAIVKVLPQYS